MQDPGRMLLLVVEPECNAKHIFQGYLELAAMEDAFG